MCAICTLALIVLIMTTFVFAHALTLHNNATGITFKCNENYVTNGTTVYIKHKHNDYVYTYLTFCDRMLFVQKTYCLVCSRSSLAYNVSMGFISVPCLHASVR